MPPLARASQRSRYSKKRAPSERDWAELHQDLISCILHRLDQAELLIGGVAGVCRSWRRTTREEPELWRRIDLRGGLWFVPPFRREWSLETMVWEALWLGAGQCEAFLCERVDDHILLILAER
ncbi:putative F-box/LRR-repeat protein 22 [Aegilops tauschii subsp. strangulata]|nr:putative F-box/LRR-repeat protein 22 [Aegilops tauschii subsp. strangulata]